MFREWTAPQAPEAFSPKHNERAGFWGDHNPWNVIRIVGTEDESSLDAGAGQTPSTRAGQEKKEHEFKGKIKWLFWWNGKAWGKLKNIGSRAHF